MVYFLLRRSSKYLPKKFRKRFPNETALIIRSPSLPMHRDIYTHTFFLFSLRAHVNVFVYTIVRLWNTYTIEQKTNFNN
jgi:hypothetical protein